VLPCEKWDMIEAIVGVICHHAAARARQEDEQDSDIAPLRQSRSFPCLTKPAFAALFAYAR
jgi:hypothetical protein